MQNRPNFRIEVGKAIPSISLWFELFSLSAQDLAHVHSIGNLDPWLAWLALWGQSFSTITYSFVKLFGKLMEEGFLEFLNSFITLS